MTGKTDMVPVLDLPSHLSQPSQSENVPIFDRGTRCYFAPENHDLGANPGKEKRNSQSHCASRPLPAVLPPVGRRVASWGGGGVRIPPAYLGACWGAFRCAESEAGERGGVVDAPPRSLLPTVRAVAPFHQRRRRRGFSAGSGVENRNDPAITGKAAGSRQNFKEENEMTNNKEKYAFWLTPEATKMIEINAPLANCGSQSEFVEKAVRFYDGYLKVQNAGAFLPHAVADVLEGSLGVFENRMAKMLFNLAVEHNITNHLLAADVDMAREEYNKLRGGSVREVTSTRGTISLRDVIQECYYD